MQYKHQNEETLIRISTSRINISDYIRNCLAHIFPCADQPVMIKYREQAEEIKVLANIPYNTRFKSMRDLQTSQPYWNKQLVDFVPSNLGKGYLFYFICNGCKRRVKYLYEWTTLDTPLCRTCCRIGYKRNQKRRLGLYYRRARYRNL
jgi:hypothetical protein